MGGQIVTNSFSFLKNVVDVFKFKDVLYSMFGPNLLGLTVAV